MSGFFLEKQENQLFFPTIVCESRYYTHTYDDVNVRVAYTTINIRFPVVQCLLFFART